jgi:hypothetical protein
MNRSTAEVAQETAQVSGTEPIKNWLKGLMDRVIAEAYGEPGLEFVWLQKTAVNPVEQSQIHAAYIQCGVMDVDEVREAIGLEARKELLVEAAPSAALDGAQALKVIREAAMQAVKAAFPMAPDLPAAGTLGQAEAKAPEAKPVKPVKPIKVAIDHSRKAVKRYAAELQGLIEGALAEKRDAIIARVTGGAGKADAAPQKLQKLEDWMADFGPLLDDIGIILERAAKSGGAVALNGLRELLGGLSHRAFTEMAGRVGWRAVGWAKGAAARLVANISGTTRESLKTLAATSAAEGLSVDEVAAAIGEAHAFSKERAELMAADEIAEADAAGSEMAHAESGVGFDEKPVV